LTKQMNNKLRDKKLFLLDMDGTLYIDEKLFKGAKMFLETVKKQGKRYVFLTNNSSKGKNVYIDKLKRLGIDSVEEDFLSSVDATIDYLKESYPLWCDRDNPTRFFICGTKSFEKQLKDAGLMVVTETGVTAEQYRAAEESTSSSKQKLKYTDFDLPSVCVLSFDTEINYKKIEDFTLMLNLGADYVATHPDFVCPTWYGMAVDIGIYTDMFRTATGREPYVVGKPRPQMAESAMKKFGCTKDETCIIGDRLTTDIACGINAGIDSIFVLSGDHNKSDIEKYNIHPTYIFKDIEEVLNEIK